MYNLHNTTQKVEERKREKKEVCQSALSQKLSQELWVWVLQSTIDIRLSACSIKCAIRLSVVFLEVKIQIKEITLFHDEITSNQIEICSKHLENNKKRIFKSFSTSYPNHVRSFAYF